MGNNGLDVLTGTGRFNNPQDQVQWHPLILEVKAVGMEALTRTAELGEPKANDAMFRQANTEPFLQCVERLQVAVEKQVPVTLVNDTFLGHPQKQASATAIKGKPGNQPAWMCPPLT